MEAYQERVVEEKRELDAKLEKLEAFIDLGRGQIYMGLPMDERSRLKAQRNVMKEYSNILGERIANF